MNTTLTTGPQMAQLNDTLMANVSNSADWIDKLRNICEIGFTLPITCFGLLGNLFAFVVLCHHSPRTTTQVLLQAIAVTDWLALFCSLVLRSLRYVITGYERGNFFMHAFRWLYPSTYIFRFAGSWMTVLLTVDRFIAVRYPLHAQRLCTLRRTYILMLTTGVGTLLFSIPRFFEFKLIQVGEHFGVLPTPLLTHRQYTIGYRIVAYLLLMYLVPMILMVILNYMLLRTLRKARERRRHMSNFPTAQHLLTANQNPMMSPPSTRYQTASNNNITVIVITVVLTSIICNSTAMVAHVLWSLDLSFPEVICSAPDIYDCGKLNVPSPIVQ
ncbi:hypothetical protein CAPTEDRAFT_196721 [Capitella teleta]|uniref:G-protein coupled receptors family 1 profile domain-containing protein n=1 Tax=Capitella teleta TaxID=283909 RepID=R7UGZ8_CAPTE|nr:hypothetical protein CAPTEDRAFT_196721 [Capitella teleta]|eukprot:ELU02542.1 hypothetical protein CAPTEDRAFT_196721 [Capitella teleta]